MKMNKRQLHNELTEIIACKLYSVQQQYEGKYPTEYDPSGWRDLYLGIPEPPPPFIRLNMFKPEVDLMVSLIMDAVTRAEDDEPALKYNLTTTERQIKMDNQHRKIDGYRELNEEEIAAMNEVKAFGKELGELVQKLRDNPVMDQRWVSIGATDLQRGLMSLTRSIEKPEFF
jgi:16S rRNA C967 or C1407 C5-methylase (RsmB/RsmF family)